MKPRYSVIIPIFDEAGNVQPLLGGVFQLSASLYGSAEILLIDDGSTDSTVMELTLAIHGRTDCRVIRFTQNQGQAAALLTGLQQALGEFILTLDGDGQNDPADLAHLLPWLPATAPTWSAGSARRDMTRACDGSCRAWRHRRR